VEIVGVLVWVVSRDLQEAGSFLFIDGEDLAEHPLAACEGPDDLARFSVEKIKVVEAGALAEPEEFGLIAKKAVVAVLEDVDKFVRFFSREDALEASVCVDLDEAVFSEAAFDVSKSQEMSFLVPAEIRNGVRVFDESGAERYGFSIIRKKNEGLRSVAFVTWLFVVVDDVFGLPLIFWRGFNKVNLIGWMLGSVSEVETG